VNLTRAELGDLPLAAALLGRDGEVVTQTPEWRGAAPGTSTYRVRGNRLLVNSAAVTPGCEAILGRLLDELDAAAFALGAVQSLQVRMLAASLRLIAGRLDDDTGTSDHVVHFARAGIRARTALEVLIDDSAAWMVGAAEAAALVLVQLAVNAERHAGATAVTISQSEHAFHVSWRGRCGDARVTTSRRRSERARWGLGFARLAADALGGAVYPPLDSGPGTCRSTLELGLGRLALPLAAVRRGVISKATRAWDEETGLLPGTAVIEHPRLEAACAQGHETPGTIRMLEGWCARAAGDQVWIAIPPADALDRARDVVDGIAHERAPWDGVTEPRRSRIAALAAVLASLLGTPLPRAPAGAWTQRMRTLAPLFDLRSAIPECPAPSALDPQVTVLLASEVDDSFDVAGEKVWLRVRVNARGDPLVQALAASDADRIAIT
jgi:hypothetical protein